ncbi:Uncharacterized protein ChrSV_3054 [Chromobacterium vaccinii]|nr:Uncharacterized protein ChrSW_3054 [Chromobacterium vaccinii]QND90511.1 Uncharacterized protein ChrSV_3054 [Chromobacterium vaccinii]
MSVNLAVNNFLSTLKYHVANISSPKNIDSPQTAPGLGYANGMPHLS